jgi:hypothetical protein
MSRKKTAAGAGSSKKGGASGGFFVPDMVVLLRIMMLLTALDLVILLLIPLLAQPVPSSLARRMFPTLPPITSAAVIATKTWTHGHKCKEFYQTKDKQKEDVTVLAIRADTDDAQEDVVDPNNVREAMEEGHPYH